MFTKTIRAAQAIAFVFISVAASAQPFNQPAIDRLPANDQQSMAPEPIAVAHMQVSVRQQETGSMKFYVAIVNPFSKSATIIVYKGRDILYVEDGVKGQYKTVFNLNELEDGNYKIVVTSGKETITKDVKIYTAESTTDRQVEVN